MLKILLVEDDAELADSLMQRLEMEDYQVTVCPDGRSGLETLQKNEMDLAIVDWELPELSGPEIISTYRRAGGAKPIIMLTGKADHSSIETGLDQGADDYLAKPFMTRELLSRLKSLLRRPGQILPEQITIGDLTVNLKSQEVKLEGKEIRLNRMEYAVLSFLLSHPNKMFNSPALLESVWASQSGSGEEAVRSCVSRLRKKITGSSGICVIQSAGSGYVIKWTPNTVE